MTNKKSEKGVRSKKKVKIEAKKIDRKDGVVENPYIKKLQSFGFTETEGLIYIYLLQHGKELGGSKIAAGTRLHRQYVYIALPKLIDSGLVEQVILGKNSKYKARPPSELEKMGRRLALSASEVSRELNMISNIGNEQEFEVIQGVRAIQQYETGLVAAADDTWECYIIGGASIGYADIMGESLEEHLGEMRKKDLQVNYLGCNDEKPFYEQYVGTFKNQEYRFLTKLPKGVTHLVVRHDTVSFYTFLNPPLVYVVKSAVIAENYKQFFMMLWEMAGDGIV